MKNPRKKYSRKGTQVYGIKKKGTSTWYVSDKSCGISVIRDNKCIQHFYIEGVTKLYIFQEKILCALVDQTDITECDIKA